MDDNSNSSGLVDDTWSWLLLLRSRSAEVRTIADMAVHHGNSNGILSMVFMGLLLGLFSSRRTVHWDVGQHWIQECACAAQCW